MGHAKSVPLTSLCRISVTMSLECDIERDSVESRNPHPLSRRLSTVDSFILDPGQVSPDFLELRSNCTEQQHQCHQMFIHSTRLKQTANHTSHYLFTKNPTGCIHYSQKEFHRAVAKTLLTSSPLWRLRGSETISFEVFFPMSILRFGPILCSRGGFA